MHGMSAKLQSAVFCLLVWTVLLCACKAQSSWQEQYDLGMRYMTESNYEEAILAFTAAIEIDPKKLEAYIALAEAYESSGNLDMAVQILTRGYEATGDESLMEKTALDEPWSLLEAGASDNLLRFEEVNLFGHSITGLDYNTMLSIVRESGLSDISESSIDEYWTVDAQDIVSRTNFSAMQSRHKDYVSLWGFDKPEESFPIGVRDIQLLDSVGTVFTKLGFTNGAEIEDAFWEIVNHEYETYDALRADISQLFHEFSIPDGYFYLLSNGGTELDNGKFSYYDMTICFVFFDVYSSREYWLEFDFGGFWGWTLGDYVTENPNLLVRYNVYVHQN